MGKTGNEAIRFQDQDTGLRLRDFWSWAYSDLLDNTLRGSFSEFLVAAALGIDLSNPRVNWDPWDLTFPTERGELHIEVKSGSYLQAWKQKHPSPIRFSIRPAVRWSEDNGYIGEQRRQSDIYVFCVFTEKNISQADPMNLDSWDFYILPTRVLDKQCREQKTINLSTLLQLNPRKANFAELKAAVLRSAACC